MGANPEETEEAESPPPPPGTSKVEITVGGHTVTVESPDPLADVVGYAMSVFEQTGEPAKRLPFGFGTTGGQFERAERYVEPRLEPWEDSDARRMGRHQRNHSEAGFTRRMVLPDPPGDHRTRLRPVQVDRGRAQVPRARD
jgi:hypothetical protein